MGTSDAPDPRAEDHALERLRALCAPGRSPRECSEAELFELPRLYRRVCTRLARLEEHLPDLHALVLEQEPRRDVAHR